MNIAMGLHTNLLEFFPRIQNIPTAEEKNSHKTTHMIFLIVTSLIYSFNFQQCVNTTKV